MAAWRWNPVASPALCLEANPFDLCYWCCACVGWGACVLKDDLDHSHWDALVCRAQKTLAG